MAPSACWTSPSRLRAEPDRRLGSGGLADSGRLNGYALTRPSASARLLLASDGIGEIKVGQFLGDPPQLFQVSLRQFGLVHQTTAHRPRLSEGLRESLLLTGNLAK